MPRHFGANRAAECFPQAAWIKSLSREYGWKSSASGCHTSHTCMPSSTRNKPRLISFTDMCVFYSIAALLIISELKKFRKKIRIDAVDQKS